MLSWRRRTDLSSMRIFTWTHEFILSLRSTRHIIWRFRANFWSMGHDWVFLWGILSSSKSVGFVLLFFNSITGDYVLIIELDFGNAICLLIRIRNVWPSMSHIFVMKGILIDSFIIVCLLTLVFHFLWNAILIQNFSLVVKFLLLVAVHLLRVSRRSFLIFVLSLLDHHLQHLLNSNHIWIICMNDMSILRKLL